MSGSAVPSTGYSEPLSQGEVDANTSRTPQVTAFLSFFWLLPTFCVHQRAPPFSFSCPTCPTRPCPSRDADGTQAPPRALSGSTYVAQHLSQSKWSPEGLPHTHLAALSALLLHRCGGPCSRISPARREALETSGKAQLLLASTNSQSHSPLRSLCAPPFMCIM